ncbi:MAG TPA: hypothetical protein VFE62_24095 [Gemmataceae bacterium]|nr:hypothetical protein [Gemmataceae bacterium]
MVLAAAIIIRQKVVFLNLKLQKALALQRTSNRLIISAIKKKIAMRRRSLYTTHQLNEILELAGKALISLRFATSQGASHE